MTRGNLPEVKGNEVVAFSFHLMDQFIAHILYLVCEFQAIIVHSASQLLKICLQLVCEPIVKFCKFNNLHWGKNIHSS